ncbi:MAG: hypothetical protein AAFQ64_15480 [Pseudomonadota bacterium]
MGGSQISLLATCGFVCGLSGCAADNTFTELRALPVRAAPQDAVPHSEADPAAPFRGTAVAVEMAGQSS